MENFKELFENAIDALTLENVLDKTSDVWVCEARGNFGIYHACLIIDEAKGITAEESEFFNSSSTAVTICQNGERVAKFVGGGELADKLAEIVAPASFNAPALGVGSAHVYELAQEDATFNDYAKWNGVVGLRESNTTFYDFVETAKNEERNEYEF